MKNGQLQLKNLTLLFSNMTTWYWTPLTLRHDDVKEYCTENFGVQFRIFHYPNSKVKWKSNNGKWRIRSKSPGRQPGVEFVSKEYLKQFEQAALFIALAKPEKRTFTIDIEANY
jgi:hypothetical protein